MNWYKRSRFDSPEDWTRVFEQMKRELGRNPTVDEVYEGESNEIFPHSENKEQISFEDILRKIQRIFKQYIEYNKRKTKTKNFCKNEEVWFKSEIKESL